MAAQALPATFLLGAARAADNEAHFVADLIDYAGAGGPTPRNRVERRELARRLGRRKGKGWTK